MGKLLKYCLSLIILQFGCKESSKWYEALSAQERIELSKERFKEHAMYYQGSPENMEIIEGALEIDPNNAEAWRELSVPYLKRGYAHLWKPLFDKAVAIDPVAWQGWRGYLYLYFYRDYERALADFNATDTLTENFTDYPQGQSVDYMRGLCYLGLDDLDSAKIYFTKYINEVIEESGEDWVDVYAYLYRGLVYQKQNDLSNAMTDYKAGLAISPSLADLKYRMASIEHVAGNQTKAQKLVEQAIEHFNDGYYHQRPYVTVQEQIYLADLEELKTEIDKSR